MSFFPTHSPAGHSKCSSILIHPLSQSWPPKLRTLQHHHEDTMRSGIAFYCQWPSTWVFVEWTSDICLFTNPQPSLHIHFGFLFSISLSSPGGWTPSPQFLAMDRTLCQRTIWISTAAIHLIVIMASAWSLQHVPQQAGLLDTLRYGHWSKSSLR